MAREKVFGSHRAIKDHTTGGRTGFVSSDVGPPSAPPSEHAGHGKVAPTKMHRHERTGEPIYANDPPPATPRGQRDWPTEA